MWSCSAARLRGLRPSQTNWAVCWGTRAALGGVLLRFALPEDGPDSMACKLACSCWARVCSSTSGRPRRSNKAAKRASAGAEICPSSTRFITFMRDCASVIWPDKKTSASPSRHCWSCDKKVDNLDSCTGKAQGSPRWSAAAPCAEIASSRKIRRVQSMAPVIIQAVWLRPRSAISISTCRHCCHSAALASVATKATVSMAVSKAAPRWRCAQLGPGLCADLCADASALRLARCWAWCGFMRRFLTKSAAPSPA